MTTNNHLKKQSKEVLINNWRGGYTVPSPRLYPFQWNWDSGFIAIGLSHFNIAHALQEMEHLFSAQRKDGFLPHIVYHHLDESKAYFPGPDFYKHEVNPNYNNVKSTPLTQPPIHGFVLEKLYTKTQDDKDVKRWKKLLLKNIDYHRYLYEYRDPKNEGLVFINHNWESGTDNSPIWDKIWERIEKEVPHYDVKRKDTGHVDAAQRPSNREYDKYLYLIELYIQLKHNDKEIAKKSPFLVQDPLFNAMLHASNQSMLRLCEQLGMNAECQEIQQWITQTQKGFNKLWNEEKGVYVHFDMNLNQQIEGITSSSFAPLLAQIPSPEQVRQMEQVLIDDFGNKGANFLCASYNPQDPKFESQRYWRGPVWINLNWIIHHGFKKYGFNKTALQIKQDTLQIVEEQGVYEYFEPNKEKSKHMNQKGYGGEQFSWTAALVLDFLSD